jgi:hypothetical protein
MLDTELTENSRQHSSMESRVPITVPKRPNVRRIALAASLLLLLGTSRPLEWKSLQGRQVEAPAGLVIEGEPRAYFGENVNNQGCVGPQRLDMVVIAKVANQSDAPVRLDEGRATLTVDGSAQTIQQGEYAIGSERHKVAFRSVTIAPRSQASFRIHTHAFLPRQALATVRSIDIDVATPSGPLKITFAQVQDAPVRSGGINVTLWNPEYEQAHHR